MARGFTIKETDVYKLILNELNDNAFAEVIKFSFADWNLADSDGEHNGLLINKLALGSEGRFDVQETFDEVTYANTKNSFVAMGIAPLNGELTALNTIKDGVYDTVIEFLVCIDNIAVQKAVTLTVEEVRARFIQYERVLETSYMDLNNPDSDTRIEETLKVIIMAQSIDYGPVTQINGKQYLTYTLPITLELTNFGEFANQQRVYLGVDSIVQTIEAVESVRMFLLEPNEWFYGTAKEVEAVQLLPQKAVALQANATEIKSVAKTKGFSFTIEQQMDLQDATIGKILRHLYKESLQESLVIPIYTIKLETYLFSPKYLNWVLTTEDEWDLQVTYGNASTIDNLLTYPAVPSSESANSHDVGYAIRVSDGLGTPSYTYYNVVGTGTEYTIDNDLTMTRKMELVQNQPNESLSKGEKIVYSLVFVPHYGG
jgi:hypothetical protein